MPCLLCSVMPGVSQVLDTNAAQTNRILRLSLPRGPSSSPTLRHRPLLREPLTDASPGGADFLDHRNPQGTVYRSLCNARLQGPIGSLVVAVRIPPLLRTTNTSCPNEQPQVHAAPRRFSACRAKDRLSGQSAKPPLLLPPRPKTCPFHYTMLDQNPFLPA